MRLKNLLLSAGVVRMAIACGSALSLLSLLLASAEVAPAATRQEAPAGDGVTCSVVMVPMRDGVKLSTEVYRPAAAGKYPVIMTRTPYSMAAGLSGCRASSTLSPMAARGYVVITQESRGTSRSEGAGQFRPIVIEAKDGYDAVEWAARQPWSSGKVGMFGSSYMGSTQWQAAIERPPHLVTIVPAIGPTNGNQGWPHLNGAFHQALAQFWGVGRGQDQLQRKLVAEGASAERIAKEVAAYHARGARAALRSPAEMLPLGSDPIFNDSELTPFYNEWLTHPTVDSYWRASNGQEKFETLTLPVLSTGGFYDNFIHGTVNGYKGMRERAATPEARAHARLVIAGGGHARGPNNYVGQLTFGPENNIPEDLTMRWFDYWLKGIKNGVMDEPAVKLFVMLPPDQGSVGSGFWASGSSFPLPGTETVRYYLGGEQANTSAGGGTLSLRPSTGSDQYRYNPANPVPTIGGAWCCGGLPVGAFDQRPVEMRPDVLIYTSERLTNAVPVIGEVSVTLAASSTAPSTAFTAKLVDVHLDGYAQIISDGIAVTPPAAPNSTGTHTILMNATGTVFKPGHRIRLEISSSNYPRFNAHTNTADPLATAKHMVVATQTIMWNGTSLNLPIAPASIIPASIISASEP